MVYILYLKTNFLHSESLLGKVKIQGLHQSNTSLYLIFKHIGMDTVTFWEKDFEIRVMWPGTGYKQAYDPC